VDAREGLQPATTIGVVGSLFLVIRRDESDREYLWHSSEPGQIEDTEGCRLAHPRRRRNTKPGCGGRLAEPEYTARRVHVRPNSRAQGVGQIKSARSCRSGRTRSRCRRRREPPLDVMGRPETRSGHHTSPARDCRNARDAGGRRAGSPTKRPCWHGSRCPAVSQGRATSIRGEGERASGEVPRHRTRGFAGSPRDAPTTTSGHCCNRRTHDLDSGHPLIASPPWVQH